MRGELGVDAATVMVIVDCSQPQRTLQHVRTKEPAHQAEAWFCEETSQHTELVGLQKTTGRNRGGMMSYP
jgi:hypothetical protein